MRVITGTARGRKLSAVPGEDTRPTSANVKEAVFNIIQFDIQGRRVLDLFAGTGQMGIETLSRGAAHAVFVDSRAEAAKTVWENVKLTGFQDQSTVLPADALGVLERTRDKFGLVFLDPPYGSDLLEKTLKKIWEFDILTAGGIIVCESSVDKMLPEPPEPYKKGREYRYGKRKITLYTREG